MQVITIKIIPNLPKKQLKLLMFLRELCVSFYDDLKPNSSSNSNVTAQTDNTQSIVVVTGDEA